VRQRVRVLTGNRPTQRVVRHLQKGWGLHAAEALGRGQFVCEYAGKLNILVSLLSLSFQT
jgi:hypothetical protein